MVISNFIRMIPADPTKPYWGAVKAEEITAYRRFGPNEEYTEVILTSGHSIVSNETVEAFERRLNLAIKPFFVNIND